MSSIDLISLDFDGTILSYEDPNGVIHPDIIPLLNAAAARGVRWCANSGRQFEDQQQVIERSVKRGLTHPPDAFICCESVVYIRSESGDYASFEPWNTSAWQILRNCHAQVQNQLGAKLDEIEKKYKPVITAVGDLMTSYLLSDQRGAVFDLYRELEQSLAGIPDIHIIRNGGWVAVNPAPLGKGNALTAYARHHGIPASRILAVGDHHNDITMLRGEAAGFVGCPGDADAEVQHIVRKAGGVIAGLAGPAGTAEILRRHV